MVILLLMEGRFGARDPALCGGGTARGWTRGGSGGGAASTATGTTATLPVSGILLRDVG